MEYYVNMNEDRWGKHEVHSEECYLCPQGNKSIYLGDFHDCNEAIEEARQYYENSVGCHHCCKG